MTVSSAATSSATQTTFQSLTASTVKEKSKAEESQSRFLKLLTAQLKNQDPLNPVDNAQTTSQLAQISTVDGVERLNDTLKGLMSSYRSSESLQAAALVGHQVVVNGERLELKNGAGTGGFDLAAAADHVNVSIRDANGIEIKNLSFSNKDAGIHTFPWDGTTNNGAAAAAGKYTMHVTASKGTASIDSRPLEVATVTSVVNGAAGAVISAGRFNELSLSDVRSFI